MTFRAIDKRWWLRKVKSKAEGGISMLFTAGTRQKRQDLNEWRSRDAPLSGAFDRLYRRSLCFGGEAETQETVKREQGRGAKLA